MPKTTDRQWLLKDIVNTMALMIVDEDDKEFALNDPLSLFADGCEVDSPLDELAELLLVVEASRYLYERQLYPKSQDFANNYFFAQPDERFQQFTRTSKHAFEFIRSELESHPIFYNSSRNPQAPVWLQLAITLDRLGNYGNGVSLGRTLKIWGVGKGTLDLYTSRVITALNDAAKKYIVWPDKRERKKISRRMGLQGFNGCVGFIDGTTIPLSQKPAVDGECYFDRKQRYSVNAQVVCDDRRRIIAFYCGWPGSCSDSTVYKEMQLSKQHIKSRYFSPGQYIIGDSEYPADRAQNTLVPAYRSNMKGDDNEAFNICLAHARVVNEQTIGVLKGRWSSLKELRVQINAKEDMRRILRWAVARATLHNMLISFGDTWAGEEPDKDKEGNHVDDVCENFNNDSESFPFRERLKARAVATGRQPGGILWHRGW